MIQWGSACSARCGYCGACTAAESWPPLREHLQGEQIYYRGEHIGTIAQNRNGTWQSDTCRDWANVTTPNHPTRAAAIAALVEDAANQRRIQAMRS